jgi:predicted RNase H-like nuclease
MITGRREADNAVSRAFGRYGAGTHSPSEMRPGAFGRDLALEFVRAGFPIATKSAHGQPSPALVEVFPLAALVRLMHSARLPTV